MNLQQLRTFVAVVEHGSFSEAARALGITQPAVTMQMQSLESELGVTLLDRRYRRVDLTEAGAALLPYARRVLEEIEEARTEIETMSGRVTGHLDIAASTTPGQYVLPRLLGSFLKQYPEVSVSLRVYDTAEVVERVEAGEAHIAMTGAEIPGARVVQEELGRDDLVMVCPPDHPVAAKRGLVMEDLTEESFVMREAGSGTRMVAEEEMKRHGVDPHELDVVLELGTNEAVLSAIEGGIGIGVVSSWVADKALKLGTVAQVDVGGFPLRRPLYLVMPRTTPTRAADALADFLRERL
ncbi:selenium metabolism-associated LysR family transcriptional regulator [Coriobacteriia bacterium Es71-Z0120]|uniref:selenium metabolism-associated LysR family transcriptional regulator n=1 Tax=Parvivirga hydrogeniphila TaxID=2939460 RepID=UPI002260FE73|nr:selenium metabolism-associated LysR family transcriptional regulator [Parvivirga hydrogeniphila]MCL4078453.1 selenium metabolism-associated LysR family transcriptional regulator [Parvivirga hydrogeniphila]